MSEYKVRADVRKNRLYLVLDGFFNEHEAKEIADRTIQEVQKLRPGFDVINDISNFKPTSQQGADQIKRAGLFVRNYGVGRLIRVVPSASIGSMQFTRKSREAGYDTEIASSVKEAERMLGPWWHNPQRS